MLDSFDTNIAKEYGVFCAILLFYFYYWTDVFMSSGDYYRDGHYWIQTSVSELIYFHPYMSRSNIRTALKKMEKNGILIRGKSYKTSLNIVMTDYAMTEKALSLMNAYRDEIYAIYTDGRAPDNIGTRGQ